MKVTPSIVQKQIQTFALTQSMQTALKILQCSQLELEQEISTILEENIMLEPESNLDEEFDVELLQGLHDGIESEQNNEMLSSEEENSIDLNQEISMEVIEDWSSYEDSGGVSDSSFHKDGDEIDDFDITTYSVSLEDHLLQQLILLKLSEVDLVIGTFLIDALDANGYFLQTPQSIVEGVVGQYSHFEIEEDEVMMVLHHIQQFDPPGIGATSLEESLIQQIKQLEPAPYWQTDAIDLLRYHSKWLLQHDLQRIEKNYGFLEEEVIEMLEGFKTLNPYPAINYRFEEVEAIKPDIIVLQQAKILTVTLNEEILPKLRINRKYAKLAQRAKIEQRDLLRNQLTEARFFLKSIEDRFDTLLKVATAIVKYQQAFFVEGEKAMRSLRLQEIAEELELNESTISRAVAGKYLICARGTYPLNYFFSNQVGNEDGEDSSSVAIRAELQEIIDAEDKTKPLSDQKLQVMLEEKGYAVSRRTVAKYREILSIGSSTQRRQLV